MNSKPGTRNAERPALEARLLNEFQRGFPLEPAPYRRIAEACGVAERQVLDELQHLLARGAISRVGAVFRPNVVGASTLAALAVPEAELERIAQIVSGFHEVNHNYAREHRYNLWFVVTAPDAARLRQVLSDIEALTGLRPLHLPLEAEYHIDLAFDLEHGATPRPRPVPGRPPARVALNGADTALLAAIQEGFPLVARPYAAIGRRAGLAEAAVIGRLRGWLDAGVIKRIGVVVRHHELGYRANAMVVWDVPDAEVDVVGRRMAAQPFVTLCYRRPRRLPGWPYNLFCMIHGRDRAGVLRHVQTLREACGLGDCAAEALFSSRRFKQCGARYAPSRRLAHG